MSTLAPADVATELRLTRLEEQMDNLPARVSDLEKYGSEHTIKHEPRIESLEQKVKRLKKGPKKKRRKERERWAKQQQRINLYIAVAGVLAVVLSTYVNYLLFHH